MREDGMRDQLEHAARDAERHGRLPSVAEVLRRGDQRRRRARATRAVAAALIVVAGGGGWFLAQDRPTQNTPAPPATATAEPSPTPDDVQPAEPAVTFTTPDGLVLATRAEAGVKLLAPDAVDGPAMPLWYTDATSAPDRFLLRNGNRTDGRDVCLSMPVEEAVSVETCEPMSSILSFTLTRTDAGTYTLGTDLGYVVGEADGSLTTSTDPAEATPFTVADPDHPGSVPDL